MSFIILTKHFLKSRNSSAWLILFVLVLIWGSSFILIKKGLESYSSNELGALRIIITFVCLTPLAFKRLFTLPARKLGLLALSGITGSGIPVFLFAYAETGIESSVTGILNSLTPLFTLIIGLAVFGIRTRWFNITGVFLGLAGAVGLLTVSGNGDFSINLSFGIYVIIATASYAINANMIKRWLHDVDSITITSVSFFIMGIPAVIYLLLFTNFFQHTIHQSGALTGLGYIAVLAIAGTAIALVWYNKLIKLTNAVFASSVTYLMPIIAIFWGMLDGEPFRLVYIVWINLIMAGVILVNTRNLNLKDIWQAVFHKNINI
ncbi:MAG: DMT family transporter [Bacteroidales bacterium]